MSHFNTFLAGALFTILVREIKTKEYGSAIITAVVMAFNIYAATL